MEVILLYQFDMCKKIVIGKYAMKYKAMNCTVLIGLLIGCISGCGFSGDNANRQSETVSFSNKSIDNQNNTATTTAKQYLANGEYERAINESTRVISDNSYNAEAYSIRGFATALQGDTEKGLADTKRAYELDPNNVANYYNMAMVYKLAGQLNDSKQWFEKVLEKDPNNTWSIYGIATIYADQGDDAKALEWLERAIKTDVSVKSVAGSQDHFERFHGNSQFQKLVQ